MVQLRHDWFANIDFMQREMERLLGDFAGRKPPAVYFSPRGWEPAIDIYETPEDIVALVELAGVKQGEIEIVVNRNTLLIRGVRKDTRERGKRLYQRMEIHWGDFERRVLLPIAIEPEETKATYQDGILELILPKVQRKKRHKVEIRG
jgi:HSP20 family protein